MSLTAAQQQAIASVRRDLDALEALFNSATPPVVVPPVVTPPAGSQVTTVGPTLTDHAGAVWSLSVETGAAFGWSDNKVLKNGSWAYNSGGGDIIALAADGVIWIHNKANDWWKDNGTGFTKQLKGPFDVAGAAPAIVRPLPSVPADVAAELIEIFIDDFDDPSTVDTANTLAPLKNWYVEAFFIGNSWANPGPPWTALASDKVKIAGSVVSILDDISGFAEGLVSITDNNVPFAQRAHIDRDANGPFFSVDAEAFKGTAFKGDDLFIELCLATDPNAVLETLPVWPSGWTLPTRFLLGADNPTVDNRTHVELDIIEYMMWVGGTICMAINAWISPRPPNNSSFQTNGNARVTIPGLNVGQWTRFGVRRKRATAGSPGFVKRYVNGIHIPECDVTFDVGSVWESLGTDTVALILGAGRKSSGEVVPLHADWVRVWSNDPANCVRK